MTLRPCHPFAFCFLLLFAVFAGVFPLEVAGALPRAATASSQNVNLNEVFLQWKLTRVALAPSVTQWKNQWISVDVEPNKSYLIINNTRVFTGLPVRLGKGGANFLSRLDFDNALLPIIAPRNTRDAPARRVYHVLIDPGHGGTDLGRINKTGMSEKMLNLDVARRLKFILERKKIKVTLTRETDVTIPLEKRAAMAKKIGADLFISIHFNAAENAAEASGIETFVLPPRGQRSTNDTSRDTRTLYTRYNGHLNNQWNVLLGYHVHAALTGRLKATDRGLRRARFHVLRENTCPAVLVECGFLSNQTEARLINQALHREKIAQGLADGIVRYQTIVGKLAAPARKI
ncbi:MAG: N-acetylmuramoyl-L-alanine amidase [Puniceicoccales bacterium]|jgi:N-acetylmuramoyl-L-alanine amidase|nr:N-acetylmuramoyl-L-alanine amidase [Puniceicoccales bacterium]